MHKYLAIFEKAGKNYFAYSPDIAGCIAKQLPENIVVQFHNNGESLWHPRFGEIIRWYNRQVRTKDANGKLISEKAIEAKRDKVPLCNYCNFGGRHRLLV